MAMWSEQEERLLGALFSSAGMRTEADSLAQSLLEHFGSLQHILSADLDALQCCAEITPQIAVLLHLTGCLCGIGTGMERITLRTTEDIAEYLRPYTLFRKTEVLLLLLLDEEYHPIECRVLQEGEADRVPVPIPELISAVSNPLVSFCVLSHNHLSGVSYPSEPDQKATREIQDMVELAGAHLLDNIIFSDEDYTSMAQLGLLDPPDVTGEKTGSQKAKPEREKTAGEKA